MERTRRNSIRSSRRVIYSSALVFRTGCLRCSVPVRVRVFSPFSSPPLHRTTSVIIYTERTARYMILYYILYYTRARAAMTKTVYYNIVLVGRPKIRSDHDPIDHVAVYVRYTHIRTRTYTPPPWSSSSAARALIIIFSREMAKSRGKRIIL